MADRTKLTLEQLRKLAREHLGAGYSKLTRSELVDALRKAAPKVLAGTDAAPAAGKTPAAPPAAKLPAGKRVSMAEVESELEELRSSTLKKKADAEAPKKGAKPVTARVTKAAPREEPAPKPKAISRGVARVKSAIATIAKEVEARRQAIKEEAAKPESSAARSRRRVAAKAPEETPAEAPIAPKAKRRSEAAKELPAEAVAPEPAVAGKAKKGTEAEATPVAAKPVAVKPIEAAPVAAKPVEAAPVAAKPVEAAPVATKPVEAAPAVSAPSRTVEVTNFPAVARTAAAEPRVKPAAPVTAPESGPAAVEPKPAAAPKPVAAAEHKPVAPSAESKPAAREVTAAPAALAEAAAPRMAARPREKVLARATIEAFPAVMRARLQSERGTGQKVAVNGEGTWSPEAQGPIARPTHGEESAVAIAPPRRARPTTGEPITEGFFVARVAGRAEARLHHLTDDYREATPYEGRPALLGSGGHRIYVLPRDPGSLFLYWDVRSAHLTLHEGERISVRVMQGAQRLRELDPASLSRGYYVDGLQPGGTYRVEAVGVSPNGYERDLDVTSSTVTLPSLGAEAEKVRFLRVPFSTPLPRLREFLRGGATRLTEREGAVRVTVPVGTWREEGITEWHPTLSGSGQGRRWGRQGDLLGEQRVSEWEESAEGRSLPGADRRGHELSGAGRPTSSFSLSGWGRGV